MWSGPRGHSPQPREAKADAGDEATGTTSSSLFKAGVNSKKARVSNKAKEDRIWNGPRCGTFAAGRVQPPTTSPAARQTTRRTAIWLQSRNASATGSWWGSWLRGDWIGVQEWTNHHSEVQWAKASGRSYIDKLLQRCTNRATHRIPQQRSPAYAAETQDQGW